VECIAASIYACTPDILPHLRQHTPQVLEALRNCSNQPDTISSSSSSSGNEMEIASPFSPSSQVLLLAALASPLSQLLPPNRQFVTRLAKQLIQAAEGAVQELGEELLQLYTALLQVNEVRRESVQLWAVWAVQIGG
jgi:hypothetical protein